MESEREDKVRRSGKKPACCKQVEGPARDHHWLGITNWKNRYLALFSFLLSSVDTETPDSAVLCVPCAEVT